MICFEFSYTGKLTFWEISRVNKELIDNMSSRDSRQLCHVYNTNGVKSNGSLRVLFFLVFNQIISVLYMHTGYFKTCCRYLRFCCCCCCYCLCEHDFKDV